MEMDAEGLVLCIVLKWRFPLLLLLGLSPKFRSLDARS